MMVRSNIPKYGKIFDLDKKSIMLEYTGMWYIIRPWYKKISHGRISGNVVCSTMIWLNIPIYDILFDVGNKK